MNWELKNLGDIYKITSGGTPSRKREDYYEGGKIPWVKTGDLKYSEIDSPSEFITESGLNNSSAKLFPPNTVLLALYGATIGACSILKIEAATNQACAALLPNPEIVNERYTYYYLKSIKAELIKKGVGGAQPNISGTILKSTKIPLPPLSEQKRIAAILDEADRLRQKDKELIEKYNQLSQSVFLDMFGDPVTNPKGWEERKIINFVSGLSTGKSLKSVDESSAGKFKVLKTSAVSWGDFREHEAKPLPFDYIPPNDHLVKKGDLLISRMNTTELVGASSYVFNDVENLALPDRIWKFVWKDESYKMDPIFVWYGINKQSFRNQISKVSSGTSGSMKNISKKKLLDLKFIIPPYRLQVKFSNIILILNKQKIQAEKSLAKSEELFQSLLQRAFKREL